MIGSWASAKARTPERAASGEGDAIVLVIPRTASFKGVCQDNRLDVTAKGERARIDPIVDPRDQAAWPPMGLTPTGGVDDTAPERSSQE